MTLRLSLSRQISSGFMALMMLLVAVAALSSFHLSNFSDRSKSYSLLRAQAARMASIDLLVHQTRRATDIYSTRGFEAGRRLIEQKLEELGQQLNEAREHEVSTSRAETIANMLREVLAYKSLFAEMVTDRRLVKELMEERLPRVSVALHQTFRDILTTHPENLTEKNRLRIRDAETLVIDAERLALLYFLRLNPDQLHETKERITEAQERLQDLHITALPIKEGIERLEKGLTEFNDIVFQRAQATRSYLYFVNVLLASQTSELARGIRLLREASESDAREILEYNLRLIDKTALQNWTITTFAVLLGMTLIAFLGHRIPTAIKSITNTFSRLAHGQSVTTIPGEDRNDEIGDLAAAASAFQKRNEELGLLLKELKEQQEALAFTNSQLDSFAYVASHDLKAPLRAIERLAEWVIEDSGNVLPEQSREHLSKIIDRIRKMKNLLEDLLQYSRVGRIREETKEVNTDELLDGIIKILDRPAGFSIKVENRLPVLKTSPVALEQVFLNLLTNAIKYNDKEQGEIWISAAVTESWVTFRVADNGPGIDPRYHTKIFEMYQRLDIRKDVEGTGMGLAIVKKQIESRGGTITVESPFRESSNGGSQQIASLDGHSIESSGTIFVFSWPLSDDPGSIGGCE